MKRHIVTFAAALAALALSASTPRAQEPAQATPPQAAPLAPDALDGTWLAGDPGQEIELMLRVSGTAVTLVNLRGEGAVAREDPGTAQSLGDGHYALTIEDGGRPTILNVVLTGLNLGLAWEQGADEVAILRRVGELPAWLAGERTVYDLRGRFERATVTFDADSMTLDVDGTTTRLDLWGIAPDETYTDGRVAIAIAEPDEQPEIAWVRPAPGGGLLIHGESEDELLILYEGERPAWIAALDGVSSHDTTDPGICDEAVEYVSTCLTEACASATAPPSCANLSTILEIVSAVPPCDQQTREVAANLLSSSCRTIADRFLLAP
jgi:hypothetical protein